MKKSILFILLAIWLASCSEIRFEEPQPPSLKAEKQIPGKFQGIFKFVMMNDKVVMEIGKDYIDLDNEKAYLSDTMVVKILGDRLVVNRLERKDSLSAWASFVLEDKGCGFVKATTFIINSETYPDIFAAQYNPIKIGEEQSKTFIVKTTDQQFDELLANDSVTVSIIMERVK